MAETLLTVAQDELAQANSEQARATADLVSAQNDLAQAQADLAAATASLVALEDAGVAIQRQIAQTTIAADGQQLFDDLDVNTTQQRSQQAAIVDAQERLAYATVRVGTAQDEVAQAAAAGAAANAAITVAEKQDADHTTWITAATAPPLSNVPGESDVTAAGAAKDAADAALARLDDGAGGDLPHDLFVRAQERRQQRAGRLDAVAAAATAAEDDAATATAATGIAGMASQAQLAFTRSESAVKEFALTAQEQYDRALSLLAGVAQGTPLNDVEKARIATLLAAAETANSFALQKARDDAQADLDAAQDAYDAAVLAGIAADPSQDPTTLATVEAAAAALPPLQQALADAQAAYEGDPKNALDALEASVPDATWSLFDDYEEALSLLADLKAVNTATLTTGLTNTEDAYAQALRGSREATRAVLALGEVVKDRDGRAGSVAQTQQSRLLQALRGDE